jgi:lysophospholipase L1-like esterase
MSIGSSTTCSLACGRRIVAVATSDFPVTPGASFGSPAQQSAAIAGFNEVLRSAAMRRGIAFVPGIFAISQAATDRSLMAEDGLHPSGLQYGVWVDAIQPVVEGLLGG